MAEDRCIDEDEYILLALNKLQRDLDDLKKLKKKTDVSDELRKIASEKGFIITEDSKSKFCMFYALSEQLQSVKGIHISHAELRKTLVQFLEETPKLPNGTDLFKFVHGYSSWIDYLRSIEDGAHGDHLILVAAANCFKTCIRVISSLDRDSEINITPDHTTVDNTNPLVLGHIHEKHYVSLRPRQEISAAWAKCRKLEHHLQKAVGVAEARGKELEQYLQKAVEADKTTCKELEDHLRKAAEATESHYCQELEQRLLKAAEAAESKGKALEHQLQKAAEVLESKTKELEHQLRKAAEVAQSKGQELEDHLRKAAEASKSKGEDVEHQLKEAELLEQRSELFTPEQTLKIKDEVGICWLDLGLALKIDPEARVRSLKQDYNDSRERAHQVLQIWMDQKGKNATVGRLACALISIGQKRIADKLLELIPEAKDTWPEETQLRVTPNGQSQACSQCHELEDKARTLKTKIESQQNKIEQLQVERKTLENEKKDRDTKIKKLREVNAKSIIGHLKKPRSEQQVENGRTEETNRELNSNEESGRTVEVAHRDDYSSEEIKELKEKNEKLKEKNEKLQKEITKYSNRVSRVFLPNGKDFSNSGVISALKRNISAKLVASRSSDGPGKASDIFDHKKGKNSGTDEKKDSWWCIDLGEKCLLVVTHYSLRHGKSDGESYLLDWQFQGSLDGMMWKDLETCFKRDNPSDPPQFRDPHPYFTGLWSVKGEVKAFRYFRILQKGRNSSGTYAMYLSGVELYGVLEFYGV